MHNRTHTCVCLRLCVRMTSFLPWRGPRVRSTPAGDGDHGQAFMEHDGTHDHTYPVEYMEDLSVSHWALGKPQFGTGCSLSELSAIFIAVDAPPVHRMLALLGRESQGCLFMCMIVQRAFPFLVRVVSRNLTALNSATTDAWRLITSRCVQERVLLPFIPFRAVFILFSFFCVGFRFVLEFCQWKSWTGLPPRHPAVATYSYPLFDVSHFSFAQEDYSYSLRYPES